jgi:hypothetical protein
MFDTSKPIIERLKDFRSVDHADGLLTKLGSKETTGIIGDQEDLSRRRKKFGSNT